MADYREYEFKLRPRDLKVKDLSGNSTTLYTLIRVRGEYRVQNNTVDIRPPSDPNKATLDIYTEVDISRPADRRIWELAKDVQNGRITEGGKNYVLQITKNGPNYNSSSWLRDDPNGNALINSLAEWENGRNGPRASYMNDVTTIAERLTLAELAGLTRVRQTSGNTGISRSSNPPTQTTPLVGPRPQNIDVTLGDVSEEDFQIGTEVIGIDKKQKAFDRKTLRYPTQIMADKGTDYLMIEIQQYVRNKSTENKLVRANTNDKLNDKASEITKIGSIILPIPSSIQDGNSVSYADGTLDSLSAAALQGVSNTIKDFNLMSSRTSQQLTQQFTSNLSNTFNNMMDAGLKGQFIRSLASQAVSSIPGVSAITPDQFLARQTGGIMNPNMELLFNGVTLRSFKFSFKMTPRDETEGEVIKQIIRNLKINMAPQTLEVGTSKKNNFIRTPNVFKLSYMQGSSPHPFLHKFKICALTDMAVNYTGEGLYATYSDATPISIILDLTFKELEPIYDTDYFENDGTLAVGY